MKTMSKMIKNWMGERRGKGSRVPLPVSPLNPQPSTLNPQQGFTIVELMMVVAVIAILAGIITMGVSGMFRVARQKRAVAMKRVLQSGLETYYAQHGEWPDGIKSNVNDEEDSVELDNPNGRPEAARGNSPETDRAFRELVEKSVLSSGTPAIDPSGLFVTKSGNNYCCDNHHHQDRSSSYGYCGKSRCVRGREFTQAVKNMKGQAAISIRNMTFGYQGPNNGYFCRYRIIFHPKTDTVEVKMQQATEDNFKDD